MTEQRCSECGELYIGDFEDHLERDCTNYDDEEDQAEAEGEC